MCFAKLAYSNEILITDGGKKKKHLRVNAKVDRFEYNTEW